MIPLSQKPKIILKEGNIGVFEIEGLFPGYGITLGNALRRVILSSLSGAAVTGVKIKRATHEFSAVPGVLEDMIDIILNLKQLRLKVHGEESQRLTISVKGEREVTAKDIDSPSQVEIINKDLHIATLTEKKAELEMEIDVENGLGYVPAETRKKEKLEIGMIAIDSIFTPIKKISYDVMKMRVGERTDYNKLRFHIETDGTVAPEEAFEEGVRILLEQFGALAGLTSKKSSLQKVKAGGRGSVRAEEDPRKIRVEDMKLSTRTLKALAKQGVKTAGGLAQKRLRDLETFEGLGGKGVNEIKKSLKKLGLEVKED